MKITMMSERIMPNTSSGYGIKVTYICTSFDKKEIDLVEESVEKAINLNTTDEEVLKNGNDK